MQIWSAVFWHACIRLNCALLSRLYRPDRVGWCASLLECDIQKHTNFRPDGKSVFRANHADLHKNYSANPGVPTAVQGGCHPVHNGVRRIERVPIIAFDTGYAGNDSREWRATWAWHVEGVEGRPCALDHRHANARSAKNVMARERS